jgi:hypothetical protein
MDRVPHPLKKGEYVDLIDLSDDTDCEDGMF